MLAQQQPPSLPYSSATWCLRLSNYRRGAARERQVKARLEEDGYHVVRVAGSKELDLVACKRGSRPLYVEVKATAAGPYATFGPAKRQVLSERAAQAGAEPVLIHWPPNQPMQWYREEEWPDGR